MTTPVRDLLVTITPGALHVQLPEFQALLHEALAQQEAELAALSYARRVRLEAEYYGLTETTIRAWDAWGIPWRRLLTRRPIP